MTHDRSKKKSALAEKERGGATPTTFMLSRALRHSSCVPIGFQALPGLGRRCLALLELLLGIFHQSAPPVEILWGTANLRSPKSIAGDRADIAFCFDCGQILGHIVLDVFSGSLDARCIARERIELLNPRTPTPFGPDPNSARVHGKGS